MSTYNSNQTVFSLSLLSNQLADRKGTVEELTKELTKGIHTVFQNSDAKALIGEWEIVWGPVVYKAPTTKDYADNTMYVAKETGTDNYVIAIAGTNPASYYGWLIEDFNVISAVPWPFNPDAKEKNEMLAKGTSIGIDILNNKMESKGQNIQSFVNALAEKGNVQLHVTGHSLGGALSPALALSIHDQLPASKRANVTISVLSSAGPTIGNKELADYYNQSLGANTQRFWNKIDMVPHAWEQSQLKQIPWMYLGHLTPSIFVVGLSLIARKMASNYDYTQVNVSKPLAGKFNGSISTSNDSKINDTDVANTMEAIKAKVSNKKSLSNTATKFVEKLLQSKFLKGQMNLFISFMKQAGYQHTTEYATLMDVKVFAEILPTVFGPMPAPDFKNRMLELIVLIVEFVIDSYSDDLEKEWDKVTEKLEEGAKS